MKFGFTLPSYTWPGLDYEMTYRVTKDMARRAEALGYDSLTVWDHLLTAPGLYGGSWLDPLMVLSCAAGATETIPLGTNILVVPIRHPVLLAKELGTLDAMSGGRFFFGTDFPFRAIRTSRCPGVHGHSATSMLAAKGSFPSGAGLS